MSRQGIECGFILLGDVSPFIHIAFKYDITIFVSNVLVGALH